MILLATSCANAGLCAQCIKIPPAKRGIAATVNAEPNPLRRAIELYLLLIDGLIETSTDRNFGAISDPEFEAMRIYTVETVDGSFDEATELGSEAVDEIEHYLRRRPRLLVVFANGWEAAIGESALQSEWQDSISQLMGHGSG